MRKLPDKYDKGQRYYQTGYWGVWSTNSSKFCFGIQTLTKTEAMQKLRRKTHKPISRTQFVIKGISERYFRDFNQKLKWREDFWVYKSENEHFKRNGYVVTDREEFKRIERDVYKSLANLKIKQQHIQKRI